MFTQINKLLRLFGGRCIIVENGEPRYVVLPAEEYLALHEHSGQPAPPLVNPSGSEETGVLENVNREIELFSGAQAAGEEAAPPESFDRDLKHAAAQSPEADAAPKEAGRNEYRVEDIPF